MVFRLPDYSSQTILDGTAQFGADTELTLSLKLRRVHSLQASNYSVNGRCASSREPEHELLGIRESVAPQRSALSTENVHSILNGTPALIRKGGLKWEIQDRQGRPVSSIYPIRKNLLY